MVPETISPAFQELRGGNKGFQTHHILPRYLGEMMGYSRSQMVDHLATLITQYAHQGAKNSASMHGVISEYLPSSSRSKKIDYSSEQIREGLRNAYDDLSRPSCLNP